MSSDSQGPAAGFARRDEFCLQNGRPPAMRLRGNSLACMRLEQSNRIPAGSFCSEYSVVLHLARRGVSGAAARQLLYTLWLGLPARICSLPQLVTARKASLVTKSRNACSSVHSLVIR